MEKVDKEAIKKAKKEAKKKLGKGASEFKEFLMQGDVVDLAVGVIIGAAFGKIVTALVDDILMPIIGVLVGGLDFTSLSINVLDAKIMYGSFLQAIVDFIIVAFSIFLFIKVIGGIKGKIIKEKEEEKVEEKKSDEVILLEEIRDLLKEQNK